MSLDQLMLPNVQIFYRLIQTYSFILFLYLKVTWMDVQTHYFTFSFGITLIFMSLDQLMLPNVQIFYRLIQIYSFILFLYLKVTWIDV